VPLTTGDTGGPERDCHPDQSKNNPAQR
jgi:hypothetical protein